MIAAGLLAATPAAPDRLFGDLLPTIGVLVVIVLVGGGIALWLRRRLQAGGDGSGVGFTLGDLRDMRARGEITDEEFDRAKSQMISGLAEAATPRENAGPNSGPNAGPNSGPNSGKNPGTQGRDGSHVAGAVPPARPDQHDGNGRNGSAGPDGKA